MGNRIAPSPQPLPDDFIHDILLRLPPDNRSGLVRASALCKAWRRIITDPAFLGRYHALHPTAPVLGFLHNNPIGGHVARFVSTTSFRPSATDHLMCHALECRHGRAVFYDYGSRPNSYVVWDPVTGERHKLPTVPDVLDKPTVVCATGGGCDSNGHRSCGRGPFIVAFVGVENPEDDYWDAHACYYASDTGELGLHIHIHLDHGFQHYPDGSPAALVEDSLYFLCGPAILRYRYGLLRRVGTMDILSAGIKGADVLSMMELPRGIRKRLGIGKNRNGVVMAVVGGGLGLACLCPKTRTMLYLLAMETDNTVGQNAAGGRWVQRRVIDLKKLLPIGNPKKQPCRFSGIAQDANVVFVSADDGVFTIDLGSSLQVRKVCEIGVVKDWTCPLIPFVSFYTESLLLKLASGKLPVPVGNQ